MAKIKPKEVVYDIPDLEPKEYSELKHLFLSRAHYGKPSFDLAVKLLTVEDVCRIYAVEEDYLIKEGLIENE